ncbi:hypothetical protein LCGC14_0884740 [marine sediment metagenome]|uniref:Uncharacterized protein n=1 Tax=marine sediment metagenome TaxID=412755 RepID=A0A0F9PLI6_9ZZZZ
MKKEPLKGKKWYLQTEGNEEIKVISERAKQIGILNNSEPLFSVFDLMSAVEFAKSKNKVYWLCNTCKLMWIGKTVPDDICACGNDLESNSTKRRIITIQNLDNSFPDLKD